jgi:Protein of unknown function (DUF4232)
MRWSLLAVVCAAIVATPAAARAPARCHTRALSGHFGHIQGAAGSRFGPLVLVNRSASECWVRGFIGGQLIGSDGAALTTRIVRDRTTPVRTVTLRPGGAAVSIVRWSAIPSGGEKCPTPRRLEVTPPDEVARLRVAWPAGQRICGGGEIDVRALRRRA